MDFVRLLRVEAGRLLREIRYYKFDQVISFFDLLLICLGIFIGMGRDLFPGQSIFYAWIGMILWRYASVGLQTACSIVEKEIRLGTLEQLMLTRCSFEHILMARMFVRLLAETVLPAHALFAGIGYSSGFGFLLSLCPLGMASGNSTVSHVIFGKKFNRISD